MKFVKLLSTVLAVALFTTFTPALAAADGRQTGLVKLVMYEVTESLVFKQRDDITRRFASASLLGNEVIPLQEGTPFAAGQYVTADATSNVNLTTLKGPVRGTIEVLQDIDPNRLSLDTLVVVKRLQVRGTLDLTQAMTSAVASIEGRWWYDGERTRHPFGGAFLIPFPSPIDGQYVYVNLGDGSCRAGSQLQAGGALCTLTSEEFVLGIPLTKAVIDLTE